MSTPTVSVVVVSRERPTHLARCIMGLSQLYYSNFEIVVVADPPGLAALARWAGQIKTMALDVANISLARNLGIGQAAGDIVAFIDDDAVPEPTWLCHLTEAFKQPDVAAAGGFVRGRNGISYQWKGRIVSPLAETRDVSVGFDGAEVPAAPAQWAVKTEGTNMAVRRSVLHGLGGFDPAYHFYLDETDLNMRLALAGHQTALVPTAQVHHGFEASAQRRTDRAPRDLFDIGASLAVFLQRHGGPDVETARQNHRKQQRQRLLDHMVAGRLEPRDIRRLMRRFDQGWADGCTRHNIATNLTDVEQPFVAFVTTLQEHGENRVGWTLRGRHHRQMAADAAARGTRITLYLFSLFPFRHKVSFASDGYWCQTGGIVGRSDRDVFWPKAWLWTSRMAEEVKRVASSRRHRL